MLEAQQYTVAASLCADVLEQEPDNVDLRIVRVRALLALRRDEEARGELSRILRWHSLTAEVFRLLGELAIRRSKLGAAETFLKQALRLAPDDRGVQALLTLVQSSNQPTVAVEKLPAATATVGCTLLPHEESAEDAPHARGDMFGSYLVDIGALTPLQLRAALDYQRQSGIRVGAAAVALGYMSEPSVEGAAHAFHSGRHA